MKILFILTATLLSFSYPQEKKIPPAEYEKYSYLAIHISGYNAVGNSTGFFIRKDKDLYFITSYHTCSCVDLVKKEISKPEWDKLYIRLYYNNGNTIYYPIDLSATQATRKVTDFVDHPDLCLYKVNDIPDSIKINSIDALVDLKQKADKTPDLSIYYSFSKEAGDTTDVHNLPLLKNEITVKLPISEPVEVPGVIAMDENIMVMQPQSNTGSAGAPVFFQYLDKNHNVKNTVFAGMVFGENNSQYNTYVLKSKYILANLK